YVQNQDRQFDLRKPGFFDVAKLVRRTNSQSLIVQDSEGSTLRFDFQSANQGPVLTGISLKFDGKALRPSGAFEDDSGKAVLEQFDAFSEVEWRQIKFDKLGRIKQFEVFYRENPMLEFKPAVKYLVESIEPVKVDSFFPFKFFHTKAPMENDVFVISDPKGRYKFDAGKVQKVVDEQADKIIKELREVAAQSNPQLETGPLSTTSQAEDQTDGSFVILEPYLRISSSRHCGVYAAAAVAENLGHKIDLPNSIREKYISRRSGSSAQDLVRFFESNGLHAHIVSGAGPSLLKKIHREGAMAVLHQSASYKAEGSEHWVAFLGFDQKNQAQVLDLPRRLEKISVAELQSGWNGNAVVVSSQPTSLISRVFQRMEPVPFLVSGLFACFTAVLVGSFKKIRQSVAMQACCLVGTTMVVCVIWQIATSGSLSKNEFARNVVASKVVASADVMKIYELGELTPGAILVDARPPSMYTRKSIPQAINIPIDFSLSELKEGLEQLKGKSRVIVFCNSDQCKWAESLCYRLHTLGINNCQVYEPGMAGFFKSK
ncbi:MAG: rhodanese-related sulfurtransferase, partial [Mariniblastus sp.]